MTGKSTTLHYKLEFLKGSWNSRSFFFLSRFTLKKKENKQTNGETRNGGWNFRWLMIYSPRASYPRRASWTKESIYRTEIWYFLFCVTLSRIWYHQNITVMFCFRDPVKNMISPKHRCCVTRQKWNNTFEKSAFFFIFTTKKDFEKRFISWEK